jgi:hypothetical protein
VVVLPAAGVMWLERGQRARYSQLQQRVAAAAAAAEQEDEEPDLKKPLKQQQQQQQQHVHCYADGAGSNDSDVSCSSAVLSQPDTQNQSSTNAASSNSSSNSATTAAPAGPLASGHLQQDQQQLLDRSPSHPSYSRQESGCSSQVPAAAAAAAAAATHTVESRAEQVFSAPAPSTGSMGRQLMADVAGSLQLAAAAPPLAAGAVAEVAPAACIADVMPAAHAVDATAEGVGKSAAAFTPGHAADTTHHRQMLDSSSSSAAPGFVACLEQLSATQQTNATHNGATDAASNSNTCSSSSSDRLMAEVHSGLAALLGPDAASAVLGAAAEAASSVRVGPRPGDMPFYTSLAATMPVSLKVNVLDTEFAVVWIAKR